MKTKTYTFITGASRGLGKCLAAACARRGMNLLLVSLPGQALGEVAESLRSTYRIDVQTFEADLTRDTELVHLCRLINRLYAVDILINNAGTGGTMPFESVRSEYIDNIMMLNMRALVMLTHALLPNLRKQQRSYILNIASLAAFGPMPFKTVYPASKAFVYSFSRGLYAELRNSGVFVSVAHPGGMATNSDTIDRINRHSRLIRSTILSPENTAEICIRQLLKRDELIIPGFMNKVSWLFFRLCPVWLRLILFSRSVRKELNNFDPLTYAA